MKVASAALLALLATPATVLADDAPRSPETGLILASGDEPYARATTTDVPARTLQAWRRFTESGGAGWKGYFDRATGAPGRVWGAGLPAPGANADAAVAEAHARAFLAEHGDLLAPGVKVEDLVLVSNHADAKMRTLGFVQYHRGIRVFGGQVNFRYKNDRMFMLGSDALSDVAVEPTARPISDAFASKAAADWITRTVGVEGRVEAVKGRLILPIRETYGVRFADVIDVRVRTQRPAGLYAVYVEAQSGEPVARRQTLMFTQGQVAFNVPVRRPGAMRVDRDALGLQAVVDTARTIADADGRLTWTSTAPAAVTLNVTGPLITVHNEAGANASNSIMLAADARYVWNAATDERIDGQLTSYIASQDVKTYLRRMQPGFAWLDGQMTVNVNIDDVCNAYSDGETTNFFVSGQGCENTARLPDVVVHETGHTVHFNAIIEGVGNWDTSLSEGVSDYLAATMTNDSGMGRGFFFTNTALRELDPANDEAKWPDDISRDPHDTGLIIAGALWDLRKTYIEQMGQEAGVAAVDAIWFGILQRAADIPSTYAEAIALDDDDGNLANGTPHQCTINAAFGAHGLVDRVNAGPGVGQPTYNLASREIQFPFQPHDMCPGSAITSAQILWSVRDDAGQAGTVDMILAGGGGRYTGILPAPSRPAVVRYRVQMTFDDNTSIVFPNNPADPSYEVFIGDTIPLYCFDFEDEPVANGWSHALEASMSGGGGGGMPVDDWQWGAPQGLENSRDPTRATSARNVVGNDLGLPGSGGRRIDGRYQSNTTTALYSPTIDTQGHTEIHLQYQRWLTVEDGLNDQASIYGNGTKLWTNVASPQAADPLLQQLVPHLDTEWRFHDVDLSSTVVDGHVQVKYELIANRRTTYGGWTIDDFCVVAVAVCGNNKTEGDEQCDDGNANDGDGCTSACQTAPIAPVCGNGVTEDGEECDGGDNCTAECRRPVVNPPAPVCGNGAVETGEACDLGPANGGTACTMTCTVPTAIIEPIDDEGGCGCATARSPAAGLEAVLLLGLIWVATRRRRA